MLELNKVGAGTYGHPVDQDMFLLCMVFRDRAFIWQLGSTISLLPSTGELHISMSYFYRDPPVFEQDLILQEYAPKNGLAKSFPT